MHTPANPLWRFSAVALTMLSVGIVACFPANDPDLGFHLATARAVLEHGWLPAEEPFAAAFRDQPFASSYALGSLLIYVGYAIGGDAGLSGWKMLLSALAFAAPMLLLPRSWNDRRALWFLWPLVATVLAAAAVNRLVERPLLFSAIGTGCVFVWLRTRWCVDEAPTRAAWIAMPIFSVLWSFTHPEWWNVWLVTALLALGRLLAEGPKALWDEGRLRKWLLFGTLCFTLPLALQALLHPSGIRAILQPILDFGDPWVREALPEFRPPLWHRNVFLPIGGGIVAVALAVAAWQRKWAELLVCGAFLFLASRSERMVLPAAVLSAPVVAMALADLYRRAVCERAMPAPASALLFVFGSAVLLPLAILYSRGQPSPRTFALSRARSIDVSALAAVYAADSRPVLCSLGGGSVLLSEPTFARAGVFADGRYEVYGGQWNRERVRPAFASAKAMVAEAERIGAGGIVLTYFDAMLAPPTLVEDLRAEGWRLVASDDAAMLLLRATDADARQLTERAAPTNARIFLPMSADDARTILALESAHDASPSQRARLLRAVAHRAIGDRRTAMEELYHARREGPPSSLVQLAIGMTSTDDSEAAFAFGEACSLDDTGSAQHGFAIWLYERRQFDRAVDSARDAVRLDPDNMQYLHDRITMALTSGVTDSALARDARRFAERQPGPLAFAMKSLATGESLPQAERAAIDAALASLPPWLRAKWK